MSDIEHFYYDGKFAIRGEVLANVRIGPYLRERGFAKPPRGKTWVATMPPEKVTEVLTWINSRGWSAVRMSGKPIQVTQSGEKKAKAAKTSNVTYKYGTSFGNPNAQLRGGGLQLPQAKEYILSKGFHYVFRRGRRKIAAYEANYSPHKLIEILVHLKQMGLKVSPSPSLNPKRWLYLDLPKEYETKKIKVSDQIEYSELADWLEENEYQRQVMYEEPGDFSIRGDSFFIWTKQEDAFIRIIFDGDTVESVAMIDPETLNAEFLPEFSINGLREIGTVKTEVLPTPVKAARKYSRVEKEPTTEEAMDLYADLAAAWVCDLVEKQQARKDKPVITPPPKRELKYSPAHVMQMVSRLTKLDEKHPFFNMISRNL